VTPSLDGHVRAPVERVPVERIHHLATVPVVLPGGEASRFVLDTGIGINLVGRALARRLHLKPTGATFTGRRMSGQEVPVGLSSLPSLDIGRFRWTDVPVGELDLKGLPAEFAKIGGFLSLGLFHDRPLGLWSRGREVRIGPGAIPAGPGTREVALDVRRDGPSVSAFVDLELNGAERVHAEIDTGSEALILDTRYLAALGLATDDPRLERRDGTDETGHRFLRYGAKLNGTVAFAGARESAAPIGAAVFQSIIYDGLVGTSFLDRFDLGFDLGRGQLVVRRAR
jgi:hypothetical protein